MDKQSAKIISKKRKKVRMETLVCVVQNSAFGRLLIRDIQRSIKRVMKPLNYPNLAHYYFITPDGSVYFERLTTSKNPQIKYVQLSYVRHKEGGSAGVFLHYKDGSTKLHYVADILTAAFYGHKELPYKVLFKDGNRHNLHRNNVRWVIDMKVELFQVLPDEQWKKIEKIVESVSREKYQSLKARIYNAEDMDAEIEKIVGEYGKTGMAH
ncbi:MAG: hypothetical protein WCL06_00085 [Bacteroidota bacterium]